MAKVSVVLDDEQQSELQMIILDRDKAEALRFLKVVVWAQVQEVRRKGLRGHLEAGKV